MKEYWNKADSSADESGEKYMKFVCCVKEPRV